MLYTGNFLGPAQGRAVRRVWRRMSGRQVAEPAGEVRSITG